MVNPKLLPEGHPLRDLPGVGVRLQAGGGSVRSGRPAGWRSAVPGPGGPGHRGRRGDPDWRHPLPAPARPGGVAPHRAVGPPGNDGGRRSQPRPAHRGAHRLRTGPAPQRPGPVGRRHPRRRVSHHRRPGPRPHPGRRDGRTERPAQAAMRPGSSRRTGADRARPLAAGAQGAGVESSRLARWRHRHRGWPVGRAIQPPHDPHRHPARRAGPGVSPLHSRLRHSRCHRRPGGDAGPLRRSPDGGRVEH